MAGLSSASENWADWAIESEDEDTGSSDGGEITPTQSIVATEKQTSDNDSDEGQFDMVQRYLMKVAKKTESKKEFQKKKDPTSSWAGGVASSTYVSKGDDDGFTPVKSKKRQPRGKRQGYNMDELQETRRANAAAEDKRLEHKRRNNERKQQRYENLFEQVELDGFGVDYYANNPNPTKFSTHCHIIYFEENDNALRDHLMHSIERFEKDNGKFKTKYNKVNYESEETTLTAPESVEVSLYHWHANMENGYYGAIGLCFGHNRGLQSHESLKQAVQELVDLFNKIREDDKNEDNVEPEAESEAVTAEDDTFNSD